MSGTIGDAALGLLIARDGRKLAGDDGDAYLRGRYDRPLPRTALGPLLVRIATSCILLERLVTGGDDYELAFTAPPSAAEAIARAARESGVPVTRIGAMTAEPDVRMLGPGGATLDLGPGGYRHF